MISIKNRLVMAVFLALLPTTLIIYGMFVEYRNSMVEMAKISLGLMADKKAEEIEVYIKERKKDVEMLSASRQTVDDMKQLHQLYVKYGSASRQYINEEEQLRQRYENILERHGYYDLFMVDLKGNVLLTCKHERDFGTNLVSGPYHEEELALVAQKAATTFEADFSQYNYYSPSNELAAFIASPVFDNGLLVGVLAVQVDSSEYEKVITDNVGLGNTVETVIAERVKGKILFLRSGHYNPGEPVKLTEFPMARNNTPSLRALSGERDEGFLNDYRGTKVIAAWRYVPSARVSMVVKITAEEALAKVYALEHLAYAALSVLGLLMIFIGLWIGWATVWPIHILERATGALAKGDLSQRVPVTSTDEMGGLARSFNLMAERLQKATFGLETEVRDRTRDLAATNEKLARTIDDMEAVEEKLRQTTAFQRAILDSANYSIISTDVNGTIKSWNRGAEKMLGYTGGEMIGKETPAILHDEEEVQRRAKELTEELGIAIEPGFEVFVAKAKLGTPDENDWTYRRKNGTTFPVRLSVTALFDDQKQITGFLGVGFDITEQQIAERSLELAKENAEAAAEEARKANQYKSEFLANMSHEIRTPLNAILGMADLLAETRLDDEQKRYLQVFRGASETLLSLINDILDLAKIEAGQLDLEETEFDCKETIDMAIGIVSPRARQKGLSLSLNIEQPPGNYLRGDPVRLRQVLLNIMSNAVKFSSKGVIQVNAKFKHVDKGVKVEIAIADQGIGIPKEQQRHLFERFKQADASVTRQFGGTGLGLAISRMLVEKMGGDIRLESEEGKGSTFIITVLFKTGRLKEAVPEENNLAGMLVLVYVEDESERTRVAGMLENTGALVRPARSENDLNRELASAGAAGIFVTVVVTYCDVTRGNSCKLALDLGRRYKGTDNKVRMLTIASGGICVNKAEDGALRTNCSLISPVGGKDLIRELRKIWAEYYKSVAPMKTEGGADFRKILLVEDAKDNQLLMKAYLKKSPYHIELAENGQQAVEKYMAGVYDLVLMDVQMPVKDGYTATKEIRAYEKKNNKPHTRIIALTANAYQEDVNNSIDAGCDAHMTKPIKKDKLIATIEEIFRKT